MIVCSAVHGDGIRSSCRSDDQGAVEVHRMADGEGILVGNGSNELIQASLTVTLGPGRRIVLPQPTFTLYKLMATALQADVQDVF